MGSVELDPHLVPMPEASPKAGGFWSWCVRSSVVTQKIRTFAPSMVRFEDARVWAGARGGEFVVRLDAKGAPAWATLLPQWRALLGRWSWQSTLTLTDHAVYILLFDRAGHHRRPVIAALSRAHGHLLWQRSLPELPPYDDLEVQMEVRPGTGMVLSARLDEAAYTFVMNTEAGATTQGWQHHRLSPRFAEMRQLLEAGHMALERRAYRHLKISEDATHAYAGPLKGPGLTVDYTSRHPQKSWALSLRGSALKPFLRPGGPGSPRSFFALAYDAQQAHVIAAPLDPAGRAWNTRVAPFAPHLPIRRLEPFVLAPKIGVHSAPVLGVWGTRGDRAFIELLTPDAGLTQALLKTCPSP